MRSLQSTRRSVRRLLQVSVALVIVPTLVACGSTPPKSLSQLSAEEGTHRTGSAVYAFPGECPVSSGEEAGVEAVVLTLAGLGVQLLSNTIGKHLSELKNDLNGQFVATGAVKDSPYDATKVGCIVVARGLMGDGAKGSGAASSRIPASILKKLKLADYPAFYLELESTYDERGVTLTPVFFSYAHSAASKSLSGQKHVSVVLALSDIAISSAEQVQGKEPFAVFRHNLGEVEIGRYYEKETLSPGTGSFQPRGEKFSSGPVNVAVLVTESEKAPYAMLALADAFTSKKGDIEKGIEQIIKDALTKGKNNE